MSGLILVATPASKANHIHSRKQLDSLIINHIFSAQISPQQVRIVDFPVDSSFTRRMFQVRVPSRFSKTLFHVELHKAFNAYEIEVPAKVQFPEHDMDIYVYHENTILRTIRLIGDTSLDTVIIGVTE